MNWSNINKVYFLGIGGIGMSALTRYFLGQGFAVAGYDKTPSPITKALENEGAKISFKDSPDSIDPNILENSNTLFIYTPAIPSENKILNLLISKGVKLYKRSEILGELSKNYNAIGIAGTHGKTTVSSITAHIMNMSHLGCQAFLGGIAKNYNSNLITHPTSQWMVVEADEYDKSFLQLFPRIGLITAMDADHLDIYGNHEHLIDTFKQYTKQIHHDGSLIIKEELKHYFSNNKHYSYSLNNQESNFYATNIQLINHQYNFTLVTPEGIIDDISLKMSGIINLENTIAASAACIIAGVKQQEIKEAIQSFTGIKRRMELILNTDKNIYYDDYAHHPEEINAAISSIKAIYPDKKLTVVFQPHLYSRTKDFTKGFAESLDMADDIIFLDIYPAREKPIEGISSLSIMNLMKLENKALISKESLINHIKNKSPELLLTLGAGDIDRFVEPLKKALK